MELKIAKLQPTEKNCIVLRGIIDIALKEILQGLLVYDWHLFKDLKGTEIVTDQRLRTLIKKHKYNWHDFKYAVSPIKKQDVMEENVRVFIAQNTTKTGKSVVGFIVWAKNNELLEYDLLELLYVFKKYRRNGIGRKLIEKGETKYILVDQRPDDIKTLLKDYFDEKTIFGIHDKGKWKPENENERERFKQMVGEKYEETITTPFENFEDFITLHDIKYLLKSMDD